MSYRHPEPPRGCCRYLRPSCTSPPSLQPQLRSDPRLSIRIWGGYSNTSAKESGTVVRGVVRNCDRRWHSVPATRRKELSRDKVFQGDGVPETIPATRSVHNSRDIMVKEYCGPRTQGTKPSNRLAKHAHPNACPTPSQTHPTTHDAHYTQRTPLPKQHEQKAPDCSDPPSNLQLQA